MASQNGSRGQNLEQKIRRQNMRFQRPFGQIRSNKLQHPVGVETSIRTKNDRLFPVKSTVTPNDLQNHFLLPCTLFF